MKRVCLPKTERDDFINALKSKDITIEQLYKLTSAERNAVIKKYVGEDFASLINARFERAMLSKQKSAMSNWIKTTVSAKDPIRRDMLKKVERIKEALTTGQESDFLSDLAEQKLGIGVTQEEAEAIVALKKNVDDLKIKIDPNSPLRSEDRMAYGFAVDRFKTFVGDLKLDADKLTIRERAKPGNWFKDMVDLAGTAKSLIATLDNSFIGRQGIKVLLNGDYKIWGDTVTTSFKLMGKELIAKSPKGMFSSPDDAVMSSLRADIYSRPNALNGKYAAAKNGYGLGQFHEEAFPTSFPAKIPLFGRLFKASETAFTGSAIKMRAELADAVIAAAEKNGIDMLDERQATAIGSLVMTLTGRGELQGLASIGDKLNVLMFAPRFLKSNFNTLTAHMFDKTMTPYARREAAKATLRIAGSIGSILTVADMLNPGSVEWDPRSTNFGKIRIGNHRYDITGGMAGLVTLASRVTPLGTFHNGEWGYWTKSGASGIYTKMSTGDFGEQTALDTFENFFEGKLAPLPAALRDIWKGTKYSGDKPTFVNTITGLTVPISVQILQEELKKGNDDILFAMIAEGLGFSATDTSFGVYGKKWKQLRENEGTATMNEALKLVTKNYNKQVEKLQKSKQWDKMTNEQQKEAMERIKQTETSRVLNSYGIK